MTAPIYSCGAVAILIFCFSSDYFGERGYHLAVACLFAVVPFAVIVGVLDNQVRYGLLCVSAIGLYASCPLVNIWSSNAIPHPAEKRAVVVALVNGMGNFASIYGSFLFPKVSPNHHRMGFGVLLAFMLIAFCMAFIIKFFLRKYPYPSLEESMANVPAVNVVRKDEEQQGGVAVRERGEKDRSDKERSDQSQSSA